MTTTEPRLALEPAVAEPDPGLSIRPRLRHDAPFADTGDGVLPCRAGGEGFVLRGDAPQTRFSAQLNYTGAATVGLGRARPVHDGAIPRLPAWRARWVQQPDRGDDEACLSYLLSRTPRDRDA